MFDQIYQSMPHLSKQRGFRNKYRTHHYLLATLEKLKEGKEGTLFSYCRKEGTLLSFLNRLNKICWMFVTQTTLKENRRLWIQHCRLLKAICIRPGVFFPLAKRTIVITIMTLETMDFISVHGKTTYKWHTDDIRVHTSGIWVTYEWHTSTYEWHTNDVRVHTSDFRMTYEYIRVTYGWHMSTYEWDTNNMRITWE